jgi:4-hydroxy-tetrahydrodipicolinate reductase
LLFAACEAGNPQWAVPVEKTHGIRESRGALLNGTLVHSVRVPGFYSSSEVIFGRPGERLALRHDSISYQPNVEGTLLAARGVGSFTGLKRGLAGILNLDRAG